jgi:hypothetical protein
MSGSLIPNAKQQFLDANGNPLAGGFVYYYIPSTTTFKNTYQNAALTILNTNPIILDSAGECIAYGVGSFRQIVTDVNGNLIWDQPTLSLLTNDAATVIYTQGSTGSVSRTVQNKLQENISVLDFGADPTGTTNSTAAILAANAACTNGARLYFPRGTYLWSGVINITTQGSWYGDGNLSVLQAINSTSTISIVGEFSQFTISDIYIFGSNSTPGSYVGTGVQIGGSDFNGFACLNNVGIRYFAVGVRLAASLLTTISKSLISYCGVGIDFNAFNSSMFNTTTTISGCDISNCDTYGINSSYVPKNNLQVRILGGAIENNCVSNTSLYAQAKLNNIYGLVIEGVYSEGSSPVTYDLSGCSGVTASGCYIQNPKIAFYASNLYSALFSGNFLDNAITYNVSVDNATQVNVIGNRSIKPNRIISLFGYASDNNDLDTSPAALISQIHQSATPIFYGSTSGSGVPATTSFNSCSVNQIGPMIFVKGTLVLSSIAGLSGNAQISFPSLANSFSLSQCFDMFQIVCNGVTFDTGYSNIVGMMPPTGTSNNISLVETGTSGNIPLLVSKFSSTATIQFSGYYLAA